MTDVELVRAAQERLGAGLPVDGPLRVGLDELFARMRANLVRACAARLSDPVRAEDVVNEALTIAWRRLADCRVDASLQAFVWGICKNLIRAGRRKMSETLTEDGVIDAASPMASALAALRDEEQEDVLIAAIAELPRVEQTALHLRYVDGVPVAEITARLGLTNASGARNLLVNARRHLGERLRLTLAQRGHGSSFFATTIT